MYKRRCPICGEYMDNCSYREDIGLVEECDRCTKCGYCEQFAYGSYGIGFNIGDFESRFNLTWSYAKLPTDIEFQRFKKAMYSYRKMLLRNHKIKTLGNMRF